MSEKTGNGQNIHLRALRYSPAHQPFIFWAKCYDSKPSGSGQAAGNKIAGRGRLASKLKLFQHWSGQIQVQQAVIFQFSSSHQLKRNIDLQHGNSGGCQCGNS